MKIKTQDLSGLALDWAVAISNGIPPEELYVQSWGKYAQPSLYRRNRDENGKLDGTYTTGPDLLFSRKWEAGGPIIEREGLLIRPQSGRTIWDSWLHGADNPCYTQGPTPLIAAMRCYVSSRLGDEVEIPSEIYNTLVVQIVIE